MVYKDTDHDKKIICASVADFNLNNTSSIDSLTETMQVRHSLGKRQKYLCTCLYSKVKASGIVQFLFFQAAYL